MTTNVETNNLGINILSYGDYDNIQSKSNQELYVVKNDANDTDNAISSRTYADVGRDAVHYGPTAPTSPYAKIWVDTSDDPVLIQPASIDMNNLSATGIENVQGLITPNFSQITSYSQSVGETFTVQKTGWLYVIYGASSAVELKLNDSTGVDLIGCASDSSNKGTNHILLEKNTVVYVNRREGTVILNFFPCKGSI